MKTKTSAIILLAFALFTLPLLGCSTKTAVDIVTVNTSVQGGQSQTVISNQDNLPNTAVITIKDFSFIPASITINKGTTVRWVNQDSVSHAIKSESVNSQEFGKGQIFEFKFENPGTYDYICGLHPPMKGRIIVN